jgi:NitT/TauT family transport system substrate-binding protein
MKRMKTKKNGIAGGFALAMTAILVISLVSCNKQEPQAAQTGDTKKLGTLKLSFEPTTFSTILSAIAKEEGYYAANGLDVEFISLASGGNLDQIAALVTGKLDASLSPGAIGTLVSIDMNQPVVVIGGTMSGSTSLFLRQGEESKFPDFAAVNVEGKRIGVKRTSTGDIVFRGYLKEQGVDLSKVSFIELDSAPSAIMALNKGEVDAAIAGGGGSTRYNAVKQGLNLYKHIDDFSPDYVCCRILTTPELLTNKREAFVAYLKGNIKAYKLFTTDHRKTLDIALKYYNVDEERINSELYAIGGRSHHPDPGKNRLADLYKKAISVEYVAGKGDLNTHIDTSVYEDALNAVIAENPGDSFYQEMKALFARDNI